MCNFHIPCSIGYFCMICILKGPGRYNETVGNANFTLFNFELECKNHSSLTSILTEQNGNENVHIFSKKILDQKSGKV